MGFSRQEYRLGLPFSSPGDLPNPGIEPWSPALQADSLPSEPPVKHFEPFDYVAIDQTSLSLEWRRAWAEFQSHGYFHPSFLPVASEWESLEEGTDKQSIQTKPMASPKHGKIQDSGEKTNPGIKQACFLLFIYIIYLSYFFGYAYLTYMQITSWEMLG